MQTKKLPRVDLVVGEQYRSHELVAIFRGSLLFGRRSGFFDSTAAVVAEAGIMGFVHTHVDSLRVKHRVSDHNDKLTVDTFRGYLSILYLCMI